MARTRGGPAGILLIDKPAGWTSHDVVAKARRLTGQRRIGHTGTLDPMATGLLVLCLGNATRLVEYLIGHDKAYTGEIVLGLNTTTDDAEGEVLDRRDVPPLTDALLRALEMRFGGRLRQRPPAHSALKVQGRRAYELARAGVAVELAEREVTIHRLRLARVGANRLAADVECGAGTYIRSLARDIGEALGCGGHLGALRRTRVGSFDVRDALTLEDVSLAVGEGLLEEVLAPADEGLLERDAVILSMDRSARLGQGQRLATAGGGNERGPLRVYDAAGRFVGVGRLDREGTLHPVKMVEESGSRGLMSVPDMGQD